LCCTRAIATLIIKEKEISMKVRHIVLIGFALSNISALIYEVTWSRELTYIFGTTIYAISTILACFMSGLALGSYWIGKYADRSKNPLRLFALLEFGVGFYGIIATSIFSLLVYPYKFFYNLFHGTPLFYFSQFILTFFALILPTTLLGATFPTMSKVYAKDINFIGQRIGVVYFSDTLGAAVGSLLSGFLLIPLLGLSKTMIFAALINIMVGWIIYRVSKEVKIEENFILSRADKVSIGRSRSVDNLIIAAFFISGFSALTYEVVWTRFLSLVFGNSTYAFSAMLSAFLIGLAIGSYFIGKISDKIEDLIGTLGILEMGIAFSAVLLLFLFSQMDVIFLAVYLKLRSSFLFLWFAYYFLFFLVFLIPTTLMGATMPIVSKIYSRNKDTIGGDIGVIFSSNTAGGILGSFAAGFILIPLVGAERSVLLAGGMNVIVAITMFFYSNMKKSFFLTSLALFVLLGAYLTTYTISPLGAGVYYQLAGIDSIEKYKDKKAEMSLLFKKDDPHALVTVTKSKSTLSLRINGKVDANNFGDLPTEYMLAFVPLLTHKNPKSVLNIGLGAGFTLSAIEDFDVKEIDVIEINPAVVEASKKIFFNYNDNALDDSRVNLIIADARNYLANSNKKYDVIISEPSNPWISGEVGLFTKEFYDIAKRHLNEEGIFCQWVPLYDYDAKSFKIFLNTFHSVFPYVQIYKIGTDAILIGSLQEVPLDYQLLSKKFTMPKIREHFKRLRDVRHLAWGVMYPALTDVEYFLTSYLMSSKEVEEYLEQVKKINSDDKPILEFTTARNHMMGLMPDELPDFDIAVYKFKTYDAFWVEPPLINLVRDVDDVQVVDLLRISLGDLDQWRLKAIKYGFIFVDPIRFNVIRSAEYFTGFGRVTVDVVDNVYGTIEEPQLKEFFAQYWNVTNLKTVGKSKVRRHDAYLFTNGGKMFFSWYCKENLAVYSFSLQYIDDVDEIERAFKHVKCLHQIH
jgi:spermidine synthase